MPPYQTARPAATVSGDAKRSVRTLITRGPAETHAAGFRMGRRLPVPSVVLLSGPLGSGKTTLTRGLAEGLGLRDVSLVSSPSFALINVYQGRCPIYHVDLYRLTGRREHDSLGLEEFLGSRGVTIVEWGERLQVPVEPAVIVQLSDEGDDVRSLHVSASAGLRDLLHHLGRPGASGGGRE
jgi:tRNA threonylcarbamoyladenosine biosynthesis protein TsaE